MDARYLDRNIDPGARRFIAEASALDQAAGTLASPDERREHYLRKCRHFDRPRPPGLTATDTAVSGPTGPVPVRVFRPAGTGAAALPGIVFFHGGGWVLGGLDSHDGITAGLADATSAVVVSVDYRLAPEHPYPAAFDDAFAATVRVCAQGERFGIDGARVAVCGDSAGGNLAAAVALAARDRGGPALRGQALVYPCLDASLSLPACRDNADAPLLSTAAMAEYWAAYLGDGRDRHAVRDAYAAPLCARDLGRLPAAFVATAAHDPLYDDGRVYADRLRAAGVPVEYREARRLVHGYLRARFMSDDAADEFAAVAAALRRMLG